MYLHGREISVNSTISAKVCEVKPPLEVIDRLYDRGDSDFHDVIKEYKDIFTENPGYTNVITNT
ncbi:hypothetical protein A3Q56_08571 [Intoshia linei]|uniref:Uncharacterized protein n=1 Tax=Intoshia linei TaxID=1819745 RepID=A0A177AR40_9BILA|nr:hypothetical protein A3Q56_08571 [Intoshia linei]